MKLQPIHSISLLDGREIVQWIGFEMAISGGEPCLQTNPDSNKNTGYTPVQWTHSSVPYLQFTRIDIHIKDGMMFHLTSHMDDGSGYHGFVLTDSPMSTLSASDQSDECNNEFSIYRVRELHELPLGIARITAIHKDGPNAEIEATMAIGKNVIRVISGEVYDSADGYTISNPDESILLQLNGIRPPSPTP